MQKAKLILVGLAQNEHVRRVFHTFWQAAGGVLISGLLLAHSTADVKLAAGAALAAGLAAVKALIVARKA